MISRTGSVLAAKKAMSYQSVRYDVPPLSPITKFRLSTVTRKIMVLDLDETLIHSDLDNAVRKGDGNAYSRTTPADFVVKVQLDRHPVRFFVHKRPHVDLFLEIVSHWYELVIYTASLEIYGSGVVDRLDNGRQILRRRYYRQHCTFVNGSYRKDLNAICADASSIFIIDNSPAAYSNFPHNAIPIETWFSDPRDIALLCLLPMLDALRFVSDVRSVLSRHLHPTVPSHSHNQALLAAAAASASTSSSPGYLPGHQHPASSIVTQAAPPSHLQHSLYPNQRL